MRKTAKAYNWKLTGKLKPCKDCQIGNIRQKDVDKETHTKSTVPGERIFIDTSSISNRTLGGSQYLLGVVDDATDMTWGRMLKSKKQQVPSLMEFLRQMKSRGTPVKYIRCDNAGENKTLAAECKKSSDLNDIQFEFTPRDSPQFNGKIERKFATIFGRMRVNNVAAHIQGKLRMKLWGENCMHSIDVENLLVSSSHDDPSYREFYQKDVANAESMRQFGEMAILKVSKRIKGKLEDRGIPVMHLGRARDHSADTYRFLNLETELILISRDAIWLNKTYGEYLGSAERTRWEKIGALPKVDKIPVYGGTGDNTGATTGEAAIGGGNTGGANARENTTGDTGGTGAGRVATATANVERRVTRSMGEPTAPEVGEVQRNVQELRSLGVNVEPDADRVAMAICAYAMVDKLQEDIGKLAPDMAFKTVMKDLVESESVDPTTIDPSKYKEMFTNPSCFDEAWNHPDPFQREKWRAAIEKEFAKMELNKVWKKVQRSSMPKDRRCVKHKWVFEIKRSGIFRARLVACGYSQVPGVDFTAAFSPVCSDVSFRIILILMITYGLDALIFDVVTAFLTGDLDEEIYMECPDGMDTEDYPRIVTSKQTVQQEVQ